MIKFEDIQIGMKFVNRTVTGDFLIKEKGELHNGQLGYYIQWTHSNGVIDNAWWNNFNYLYELDKSWKIKQQIKEFLDE